MPKNHLILYGTADCHLCEDAQKLIQQFGADLNVSVIDIVDDADCFSRYEFTIPVIKSNLTGAELHWPFDIKALSQFISSNQ